MLEVRNAQDMATGPLAIITHMIMIMLMTTSMTTNMDTVMHMTTEIRGTDTTMATTKNTIIITEMEKI